jgi:hypothetical protein
MSVVSGPSATAIDAFDWVGTELLVLSIPTYMENHYHGGRYRPDTDAWAAMDTADWFDALAYDVGSGYAHAWSGTEWYVWGVGYDVGGLGGRFDPASNHWTRLAQDGAPSARRGLTGIWIGDRFMVWGGTGEGGDENGNLDTGAIYDPSTDSWSPVTTLGSPMPRSGAWGFWTGSEVVIWGGENRDSLTDLTSGGLYDPGTDSWRPISEAGAPKPARLWPVVWTGSKLIAWNDACPIGDDDCAPQPHGYMASYDPAADEWTPRSTEGAPELRGDVLAVWTGSRMIVWSGAGGDIWDGGLHDPDNGGVYDPSTDTWTIIPPSPCAPCPRHEAIAVWTGKAMIVWGGWSSDCAEANKNGGIFVPAS